LHVNADILYNEIKGKETLTKQTQSENYLPELFRAADLLARGIPRGRLRTLLKKGEVEHVGRGLYRLANVKPNELETVALTALSVPGGIICLLSALQIHEIGTQSPHDMWIAVDRKARKPAQLPISVRVVRFSGPMLTYGIQTRSILGVPVRVTSPARTVVDCFRYRNKIGLDIALEALRDAVRSRKATMDEITRAAEVCRARSVIRAYLEALAI
jgi:predicted transcriptional regulator of viral defense system